MVDTKVREREIMCWRFGVWGQTWRRHMLLLTFHYSELVIWSHLDPRGQGNVIFLESSEDNKMV